MLRIFNALVQHMASSLFLAGPSSRHFSTSFPHPPISSYCYYYYDSSLLLHGINWYANILLPVLQYIADLYCPNSDWYRSGIKILNHGSYQTNCNFLTEYLACLHSWSLPLTQSGKKNFLNCLRTS